MARQAVASLGMLFLAHAAAAQLVQQGNKLVGTGAAGSADQGSSVAISADGSSAIVGGPSDNFETGAVWVFVSSPISAIPMLGGLGCSGLALLVLAVGAILLPKP